MAAADDQLLASQTIHAAARAHGLRVSFAPLVTAEGVANGGHIHSSLWREGENLLPGSAAPGPPGASYIAGLLRDLPAITAITAPSLPSLARLRPGYFASAHAFWGIENREAALRYVPSAKLVSSSHANVELKPSDASANPYLALAGVIAAGLAGPRPSRGGRAGSRRLDRGRTPARARQGGVWRPPRGVSRGPARGCSVGGCAPARRSHRRAPLALLSIARHRHATYAEWSLR